MIAICNKTHKIEATGTNLETGEKFTKVYEIHKGATGKYTIENSRNRIMIRLDNAIKALNENEAPYESQLYRTFIPINYTDDVWDL